jgi:hypothetical protein
MRFRHLFLLIIISVFILSGCTSNKAEIAGKVVDWKGQAMSGVKVTAQQLHPSKGYEQFETTTDSDGIFHFHKAYPNSEYAISMAADQWKTEQRIIVQSGTKGKKNTPMVTIVIRFTVSNDGVITDTRTGMQWIPIPDYTFSWDGAISHVQNLRTGGYSDWRLPSRAELRQLFDGSSRNEITATFHIGANTWVWSSEPHDSQAIWRLNLLTGAEDFIFRGNSMGNMAMVAVRTPK